MIYLYHARKTGGRSIIHSFMNLATSRPERLYEKLARQPGHRLTKSGMTFVGWEPETIKKGDFFFGFSHIPLHTLRLPNGCFRITCLRDPYQRLQSYFNYLMDIKQEVAQNPQHVHANMPDLAWAHEKPQKFLAEAPRSHVLNQLFMFSKALDPKEAARNLADCDFILMTKALGGDLERLGTKLKLGLCPKHVGESHTRARFTGVFKEVVRKALEPEYEMMHRLRERGGHD